MHLEAHVSVVSLQIKGYKLCRLDVQNGILCLGADPRFQVRGVQVCPSLPFLSRFPPLFSAVPRRFLSPFFLSPFLPLPNLATPYELPQRIQAVSGRYAVFCCILS